MGLFRKVRRMMNKATENDSLKKWKSRLNNSKTSYGDDQKNMKLYHDYYKGTRELQSDPNTNRAVTKKATNVRNIVYELIESQIDSSIPMPKVRALHEEDDDLAKMIEKLLENMVDSCDLAEINDLMERVTPVQGGDYFQVQWNPNGGTHSSIGAVKVVEVHPKKLIPQNGMTNIEDMDYFFIETLMTKKAIKRTYGIDVEDAQNDDSEMTEEIDGATYNTDLLTVNTAYYRNDQGGVGIYVWCDSYELLDMEDYLARHKDICSKCGATMVDGVCPECGCKKAKKVSDDYEELIDTITVRVDGSENTRDIPPEESEEVPMMDENGQPVTDEIGNPKMTVKKEKKKVPYYKPNLYPVVLRKNISDEDKLLGASDVQVIIDQQDTIKKLGTKINEKLLKGGSAVTLPEGVDVEKSDKDFKIIRLRNANDKSMIDVINLQPAVTNDVNLLEQNYNWAKSALGITDAYQGKYDSSATSGTAKQYSINQAAGRLESKRTLKNNAYAKLYELMFKFWLAYADQTTEITSIAADGSPEHHEINRHDFLKIDKAGEFYWDDEFIFDTDPTSTLMANREAMWNQTDMKLQSQAFGPLGDLQTLRTYWTFMKANGYPNAGKALEIVEQRIQQQKEQAEQMQQGGDQNGMPDMPQPDANSVQ